MPKLRDNNVPVLNQYLVCKKKRNQPRIHNSICEVRCKKFKKCPYYGEWYREYYGKELEKKVKSKKYKTKAVNI